MELDYSQARAVNGIISDKKIISITGMPGSGKTFTVRAILDEIHAFSSPKDVYLACPTGKAAKVLIDALDVALENEPSTIHRMLGCRGHDWEYNEYNKLSASWVILDESSMIDSMLMARIMKSVSDDCRFILVGDKDQLPPVGAGCVFRDIIAAGSGDTVFRLEVNHRQQEGSLIADACGKVIDGCKPTFGIPGEYTLGGAREDDLFFIEEDEKELIPEVLVGVVRDWHDAGKDYCVLAPQKTGVCGVEKINKYLQEQLNPPVPGTQELKTLPWLTLREGDKVMHIKNNYSLDVFNGFTGTITEIEPISEQVTVDFDGQIVTYCESSDLKELVLGYCMTIHKSQGSQYQYGAIICHSSHYYMWSRQLLYTALSRFREELYVIGNKKALKRAVSNSVEDCRQTYLSLALGEE